MGTSNMLNNNFFFYTFHFKLHMEINIDLLWWDVQLIFLFKCYIKTPPRFLRAYYALFYNCFSLNMGNILTHTFIQEI